MSYKQQAYAKGEDAAKVAASWVIDGNTPQDHIRRMVKWFDDGDPQYSDYLPQRPNLSGEWESDLTPTKLYYEIIGNSISDDVTMVGDAALEVMHIISDTFDEGVSDHFEPECERILRAAITEE